MQLQDIRAAATNTAWVRPLLSTHRLTKGHAEVRFSERPDEYQIIQHGALVPVRLRDARQENDFRSDLGSGRARLAHINAITGDGSAAQLVLHYFNGDVVEMGDVEVGISEHVLETAQRSLGPRFAEASALAEMLAEICALRLSDDDRDAYFLMTAGAAASRDFDDPSDSEVQEVPERERCFSIHGVGARVAVARSEVEPRREIFLATRMTTARHGTTDGATRLARGRLRFSDWTRTGEVAAIAAGAMTRLVGRESSYLRRWDEYGAREGEVLLEQARHVGMLRWTNTEPQKQGIKFHFDQAIPEQLSEGDELELVVEEPPYLRDREMDWGAYCRELEREQLQSRGERDQQQDGTGPSDRDSEVGVGGQVREVGAESLVLDLPLTPTRTDLALVWSMRGERTQIERRMEARRLVVEHRSANPMLGLIIEEDGVLPPLQRQTRYPALTGFVREKVFSHRPTDIQEQAIGVALNTPDIALIQGPPGTGKTTVIAAIVERLNQMYDKTRPNQGEILISGFQHDAVENMMSRLQVNSLPIPKFGRRSGQQDGDEGGEEKLRQWCQGIIEQVRKEHPGIRASEQLRKVETRCNQYLLSPSLHHALSLLGEFAQFSAQELSVELAERAVELRELLKAEQGGGALRRDDEALRTIYGLRTSPAGFQDDGPAQAQLFLVRFGGDLSADEKAALEAATRSLGVPETEQLRALRRLKERLLGLYLPRPHFRIEKPREDIITFVTDAMDAIRDRQPNKGERVETILAEFLHELDSDPQRVRRAIEEYGLVFAATCQHSVGRLIRNRKRLGVDSGTAVEGYDTVIVDEAARTGPRDLLIPMVQARRRIILVGDHRQLPHLINEDIARKLESESPVSSIKNEAEYIRESMFQYLLGRLKALESKDGVRRYVTLDKQFRMHPTLGQLISDCFYAPFGEGFESPRPASDFSHELEGCAGAPAIWLDAPLSVGGESRSGTSRRRKAEAAAIAQQLSVWIDSPAAEGLSFGLISFYKAQKLALFEALAEYGVTDRDEDGNWAVRPKYAYLDGEGAGSGAERLRIGTVDAFQGMEFDVVFLSMVRTAKRIPEPEDDPDALNLQTRRLYGHLTSPNRLCVSMSRQKRMLVVAGDASMVDCDLGQIAVPALSRFWELCKEHGGIR